MLLLQIFFSKYNQSLAVFVQLCKVYCWRNLPYLKVNTIRSCFANDDDNNNICYHNHTSRSAI